ncbi:hypothetical protein [Kocuria atrinae]|uniref:hypothetical protein n=1 Tax=Kocuria atrinae TaxID=592377 RepID=UPI000313367B|nr:hypothetical protein [Kocuria atrinae]
MIRATPYIGFEGQAEEALTFYHSIFGGELNITRFKEMGMVEDTPEWSCTVSSIPTWGGV